MAFDIQTDTSVQRNQFALSPDGTRLVSVMATPSGPALWLRRLDEVDGHVLVVGAGTTAGFLPFWSADSRFLAFFADGKLNKIDASASQALCDAQPGGGGTWNRDDVILFAASEGPLFSVAAGGGVPRQVTALDRGRGELGTPAAQILAGRPALHLPCAEREGREYRARRGCSAFKGNETARRDLASCPWLDRSRPCRRHRAAR